MPNLQSVTCLGSFVALPGARMFAILNQILFLILLSFLHFHDRSLAKPYKSGHQSNCGYQRTTQPLISFVLESEPATGLVFENQGYR
jgi:hypothetical protein